MARAFRLRTPLGRDFSTGSKVGAFRENLVEIPPGPGSKTFGGKTP